ncbi:MAG: hypothetical protein PHQ60_12495 [Sideroxydans sp.]|nr:hypothetical protein [Sideroxydans sp.]
MAPITTEQSCCNGMLLSGKSAGSLGVAQTGSTASINVDAASKQVNMPQHRLATGALYDLEINEKLPMFALLLSLPDEPAQRINTLNRHPLFICAE